MWKHLVAAAADRGEVRSWSAARRLGRTDRLLAGRGRPRGVSPRTGSTAALAALQLDAAAASAAVTAAGQLLAVHGGHFGWHVAAAADAAVAPPLRPQPSSEARCGHVVAARAANRTALVISDSDGMDEGHGGTTCPREWRKRRPPTGGEGSGAPLRRPQRHRQRQWWWQRRWQR